MKTKTMSIVGIAMALVVGLMAGMAEAASSYDTFASDPNIAGAWSETLYYNNTGTRSKTWNAGSQDLGLGVGSQVWCLLRRTGTTRAANDIATITIKNYSPTGGSWCLCGVGITQTTAPTLVDSDNTTPRYIFMLTGLATNALKFSVLRDSNMYLYTGTATNTWTFPIKMEIVPQGSASFYFNANGTTVYTGTYYNAANSATLTNYHITWGTDGTMWTTVDDFGVPPPSLGITTTPANGQAFVVGSSISATATVTGGTSPYSVTFFTNVSGGAYGSAGSTNASPYTINLGTLAVGTYGIYASVTDSVSATSTSATNTFSVVPPPSSFFWTNAASGAWDSAVNWTNDVGAALAPVTGGQTNYTLNFNNAGTYTASNNLSSGFLLNRLNFGGPTLTLSGYSLALTNDGASLPQVNQNSAAAVTINNNLVLGANTTFGGTGAGTTTVAGAMSGAGSLTKTNSGTLVISSTNNSYSGATVISNGTVKLGYSRPIPTSGLLRHYTFDGVTNDVSGNGGAGTLGGSAALVSGGGKYGSGYLSIPGGTSYLTINGSLGTSYTLTAWYQNTYASSYRALWMAGTGEPVILNTGTQNLGTYFGSFVQAGSATLPSSQNTDNTWHFMALVVDNSASTLKFYTENGSGGLSLLGTISGTVATTSLTYLGNNFNFGVPFASKLDDAYVYSVALGVDDLAAIMNNNGTGSSGSLPANAALSIASSATFDLNGSTQTVASVSDSGVGGGLVTNSGTSATLTINPSSGSTTFSGAIRGPISLVKSGIGTQVLAGASAYAGGTTVSNGALLVNGSITGAVNVISGATLGGTGAITGNVAFASGALAQFTNNAPMTFSGPVTLINNVVHLTLPDSLPDGTYLLSTNTSGNFSGSFAATPVIDSGSTVGSSRTITTDAGAVRLVLTSTFTITLLPASLPAGTQGVAYSQTIIPGGGTAPYTNTVIAGSLPSGLTLAENGLLSGIPDTAGLYSFTVQAKDAAGYTGSNAYSVTIYSVPASFFWTNTVSGGWDVAGNWTNDVGTVAAPASAGQTNYTLNFNNAGTYTASNNLSSGFLLNQLNFGGATVTLAGNSMAFTNNAAALPHINQNSAAAVTVSNAIVLGANATLGGSGAGTVTVAGVISGANSLTMTHAGTLTLSGDNNLTGLFSAQAGTVVNTANWVGNGRGQQKAQVGGSATSALWTNSIPMTIGTGAPGVSNTFTVATQGTLRVNGGLTVGTNGAAYNALVVTNGGQAFSTAASTIGNSAGYNSVKVIGGSGGASWWNLGGAVLNVGSGVATANVLTVDGAGVAGGAVVTNSSSVNIGASSGSVGNSVLLTNGAQMVVASSAAGTYLGWDSNTNSMTIAGGAANSVYNGGGKSLIIGAANGANSYNNLITIGAGGVMTNIGGASGANYAFAVGWTGNAGGVNALSNRLVVTDGGKLFNINDLQVGSSAFGNKTANGNAVLIANTGVVSVAGGVVVGYGSASAYNSLTITNGGQLSSGTASTIGSSGNSNTVTIVGGSAGTSLWNLGGSALTVGAGGAAGNVLKIDGAGMAGGAVVTNVGATNAINLQVNGTGNSLLLTNGARMFVNTMTWIGNGYQSNTITVAGGAANSVFDGGGKSLLVGVGNSGAGGAAAGNQLYIGAGGSMTNVGGSRSDGAASSLNFAVGWAYDRTSNSNRLMVTEGGQLSTVANLEIGVLYSGSSTAYGNSVLIANTGVVNVAGGVSVGVGNGSYSTTFNTLTITNGGRLYSKAASTIGNGGAANNNSATILGGSCGNALWDLGGQALYVGSGTTGNVLMVGAGGVVTNLASLTVPAANSLTLGAGGQIYAAAATDAGTLTVGIDDTATPACGRLTVSGNLNINGATLNIAVNGSPAGSAYVIATYDTRTAGNFAATNGLPYGWVLDLNYNSGKAIALVPPAPPTLASLSPTNNATDVLVSTPLVATFSEAISLTNGGVITITNLTAGTASDIVLPSAQVTANGAILTITPAANLAYSSTYAVLIGTNTIRDPLGLVAFAGITSTTTWHFITQAPVTTLGIANLAVSGATASSAVFNATLQTPGTNADVFVYWGPTDGTNNPAAWSNSVHVGSWTDVASTNIGFATNGLAADTRYYYTFLATNTATNIWASPSATFAALRPSAAVARYWDGGTTNIPGDGNGVSAGGAGTWDTTLQNWDAGAVPHEAWNSTYNDTAIFGGVAGGTVLLNANVTVGGLTFNTAGYTISGVNTLAFGADGSIAVNADATLSTLIGGSAAVAKTGAGTLTNSGDNTLTGLFSVQTGTIVNTANWVGNGRSQQKVQVGGYGAAALWTNSTGMVIGTGAAGLSNTVTVASQGVLRVNGGLTVGTSGATFNSLIVANGGQVFSTNGASIIGYNATNNSVQVIGGSGGPASLWNLGGGALTVGSGGAAGNVLRIDGAGVAGGAVVTNVGAANAVNLTINGTGNSLLLTNGARMFVNTMTWIGNGYQSNAITIAGGAANSVFDGGGKSLLVGVGNSGAGGAAAGNQLYIGAGGSMTNVGGSRSDGAASSLNFAVGWAYDRTSDSNRVTVTDGGQLSTVANLDIGTVMYANPGGSAGSNAVLIANTGVANVAGGVNVGMGNGSYMTTFNSLTITNGGRLYSKAASTIGNGGAANNNSATILGGSSGNALWDLGGQALYVGSGTTGNVLTVGAGGMVTNLSSLTVSATNRMTLAAGGQIYANAATNTGTLTVGLDDAVTPACGRLTASGNLNITGATLTFAVTGTPAQGVYVIASYGSLTGTFAATNGLPPDGSIDYDFGGSKQMALVVQARGTVFKFR